MVWRLKTSRSNTRIFLVGVVVVSILLIWFFIASFDQPKITVNWSDERQTIDGFGAATASVNPRLSSSLMDFFYTSSGIGLHFLRVRLLPDNPTCQDYGWTCLTASGATTSLIDYQNALAATQRGAVVWATEWDPPSSMCPNGTFVGSATNMATLAADQADFVKVMTGTYGIPIYAISPQNEPEFGKNGCIWTPQQIHDYVPYLSSALSAAGYRSTKIMVAESSEWGDFTHYTNVAMNDSTVAQNIGILASHGYQDSYAPESWSNFTSQRIWETEVSDFHTYDGSMTSGLTYATDVYNALAVPRVNAYHFWSLSGYNFSDNEGLTDSKGNPAKRAYTIGNFSKFVLPGWTRVGVMNSTRLLVSAYKGPSGGATIVVINRGSTVTNQAFSVGTLMGSSVVPWITSSNLNLQAQSVVAISSGSFTYTIPRKSVVSFASSIPVSAKGKSTGSPQ